MAPFGGLDVQIAADNECLLDRLHVATDRDAEPVDLDEAVASFLLSIVSKRRTADTPAAVLSISTTGAQG